MINPVKCPCGYPNCDVYGTSDGIFYQGTGWDEETARRHAVSVNLLERYTLGRLEHASATGLVTLLKKPNFDAKYSELLEALQAAKRLIDEALPKFNWAASALDANAIQLLNEVPGIVSRALED